MSSRLSFVVLGFVVGVACMSTASAQGDRRYVNGRSAANPANATQPPFSGAVIAGNTVYLSGVLGTGETADAAAKTGLDSIRNTLQGLGTAEFMSAIGHEGEHPEGRFYPDTYRFAEGTTDREIFVLAYRKMAEALQAAWSKRAGSRIGCSR